MNPGRSLFLIYGMKDFPRTTILYLYFFEYDEIFLPFLHSTYPENTELPSIHMVSDHSSFYNTVVPFFFGGGGPMFLYVTNIL